MKVSTLLGTVENVGLIILAATHKSQDSDHARYFFFKLTQMSKLKSESYPSAIKNVMFHLKILA